MVQISVPLLSEITLTRSITLCYLYFFSSLSFKNEFDTFLHFHSCSLLSQNDDQLSKWENDILLTPGDDTSSYAASQPPSVAGPEWSAENSMEDFPEGLVKEEDSMMDMMESEELDTTGEEFIDFRAQLSTTVSSLDQC